MVLGMLTFRSVSSHVLVVNYWRSRSSLFPTTAKSIPEGMFTWRESSPANRATRVPRANFSYVSLENASKRLHATDRVARLPGAPCLLVRGTRLGGVAFYHANRSCRAIPANRSEINRKNMAARGEFFRSYHLPMSSAKQNDSQSEEINVTDESQAENRPVPVQEAEIRWKKVSLVGRYVCCA